MMLRLRRAGLFALLALAVAPRTLPAQAPAPSDSPVGREIAEIQVVGLRARTRDQVVSKLGMAVGKKYEQTRAESDTAALLKEGWFLPGSVTVRTEVRRDGKVKVVITVSELKGVIEALEFKGAIHLSDDELTRITLLHKGDAMSVAQIQNARVGLLKHYREQGWANASVRVLKGLDPNDTAVVFDISEGDKAKLRNVSFEFLNKPSGDVPEYKLKTMLTTGSSSLKAAVGLTDYKAEAIENDEQAIADYYAGLGFLAVRVKRELIYTRDGIDVVYHIDEGARFKVGQVRFAGNQVFDEAYLLQFTNLRPGDFAEQRVIQADAVTVRNRYGSNGRPVVVREQVTQTSAANTADVVYQIEEKPPDRVNNIIIVGNTVTQEKVIRRQLGDALLPGQILSYPALLEAQQNLNRLQLFQSDPSKGGPPTVEVAEAKAGDPMGYRDIIVRVKEGETGVISIGGGVTSDAGLTGNFVINERNFDIFRFPTSVEDFIEGRAFRGAGQEFRIEAVPGTTVQRYTVSFREPYFFDQRYSLAASGYYYTRSYNEYTENRLGGRLTLGRRLDQNWTATLTQREEQVNINNLPVDVPDAIRRDQGNTTINGTKVGLSYDSRDNLLRPSSGGTFDVGFEQVYGQANFPGVTAEAARYFTLAGGIDGTGKHILSVQAQAAYVGPDAPVFERLYAGGFRSLRGFQFRGVGPRENGYAVGGDFSLLGSVEYHLPIPVPALGQDNFHLVFFGDAGTVERNVEIRDLRASVGFGFRIAVPQLFGPVPLALDFGFPVHKMPGDQVQVFSFNLGVAR